MGIRETMGLYSNGDKYNLIKEEEMDGIQNMKKLIEDLLKKDEKFKVHVEETRELLERCRSHGISISKKKFIFSKPRVKYVGFIVRPHGIGADPAT